MGLDLRILPQYGQKFDFSLDVISLHRDSDLFDIILKVEKENGREIPRNGINSYFGRDKKFQGNCYGKTTKTVYGTVLRGVRAKKLKIALKNRRNLSWKNKAFIAFLNKLPDDLEIWLYWH